MPTSGVADMLAGICADLNGEPSDQFINSGYAVLHQKDEKRKSEMDAKHKDETVPTVLANIEKRLTSRRGQFLVGNTLSWADIQTLFFCSELGDQDILKNVPEVANLVVRIGNLPNIKAWVETRPNNPF